jgi:hypothetical protein
MPKEKLKVVSAEPVSAIEGTEEVSLDEPAVKPEVDPTAPLSESDVNPDDKPAVPEKPDKKDQSTEESKSPDVPPKPKRPVDPIEQMRTELKEAFPNVEDKLINTVIIASSGTLELAFNALLYYNDPSLKVEINQSQLNGQKTDNLSTNDDELLARRLQKEFEDEERRRHGERKSQTRRSGDTRHSGRRQSHDQDYDSPDEFEQIKESFTQGFEDAKTTINSWVSGIAKKFDNVGENDSARTSQPQGKLFGALGGSSANDQARRKGARFDEDPQIITNDFHDKIKLDDNENDDQTPKLPSRPNHQSDTATTTKKWQPITSDVGPNSDAFLVDDSDDEEETKKQSG